MRLINRKGIPRLWLHLIVASLMLIVSIVLPQQAHALSCAEPGPILEEMERSEVAFRGIVLDTNDKGLTLFEVVEAWKGVEEKQFKMYSNGWDPYEEDAEYLVLGSTRDGELRTNLCGNSGQWHVGKHNVMEESGLAPLQLKADPDAESGSPSEPNAVSEARTQDPSESMAAADPLTRTQTQTDPNDASGTHVAWWENAEEAGTLDILLWLLLGVILIVLFIILIRRRNRR